MKKIFICLFSLSLAVFIGAEEIQDWAKYSTYEEANKSVKTTPTAVFMGNSITQCWFDMHPAFFTDNNYLGRGIGGQTTYEMLARFQTDVVNLSPQYVVILAGTNDLAQNQGYISLANIANNIKSMCQIARCNKIEPILCSVLPVYKYAWRKELGVVADQIKALNTMIKDYATSEGITYVDYHSAMQNKKGGLPSKLSTDGVHLKEKGYNMLERIIKTVINSKLRFDSEKELSLKQIIEKYYVNRNFTLGAASKASYLHRDTTLLGVWKREFHYNTPENYSKQIKIYPYPGAEWDNGDMLNYVSLARKEGQVIRLHSPISPQCSNYIMDDDRNAEEMQKMLVDFTTRFYKEIETYSDVVKWCDVVNETLVGKEITGCGYFGEHDQDVVTYKVGDWFGPRIGHQWENPWTKMGFENVDFEGQHFTIPKYILSAFKIATENAPNIKLVFNQDGDIIDLDLWEKLYRTIRYMRSIGLRVDAVAYQCHVALGWEKEPENLENLQKIITLAHENNLEFHISELDVMIDRHIPKFEKGDSEHQEFRRAQSETISAIVELCLKNIGKGVTGINFWTMSENYWIKGKTFSSLLNPDGTPHEAYHSVKALLLKYAE